MAYETIIVETRGRVGLIRLNRPKALNALSRQLVAELGRAIDGFEADEKVHAMVLTGGERAFAAGADIGELAEARTFVDAYLGDVIAPWERVAAARKPVVAAVAGYALGGGCEIALMCDIIIAADNAQFGFPEITIGTMPGAGGTQRLTRIVGKAKAMEMCLTGRRMEAAEAERTGLVARVVPADALLDEAIKVAARIGELSLPAAMLVKESINRAYETTLAEGIRFERRLFYATFSTEDRREGMAAFAEKRQPQFRDE